MKKYRISWIRSLGGSIEIEAESPEEAEEKYHNLSRDEFQKSAEEEEDDWIPEIDDIEEVTEGDDNDDDK